VTREQVIKGLPTLFLFLALALLGQRRNALFADSNSPDGRIQRHVVDSND
jgi:hypothetical protein